MSASYKVHLRKPSTEWTPCCFTRGIGMVVTDDPGQVTCKPCRRIIDERAVAERETPAP